MSGYNGRASVPKKDYYSELFSAERERGMAFEKEYSKGLRSYALMYYVLFVVYAIGVCVAWLGSVFLFNFTAFWLGCCVCCLVSGLLIGARRAKVCGLLCGIVALLGSFGASWLLQRSRAVTIGLSPYAILVLCLVIVLIGFFGSVFFWDAVRFLRCNLKVVGEVSDIFPVGDSADGKKSGWYYPVVEYVVDDLVWHTALPKVRSGGAIPVGSSVQVWCASDNPNIAFTRGIVKRSKED